MGDRESKKINTEKKTWEKGGVQKQTDRPPWAGVFQPQLTKRNGTRKSKTATPPPKRQVNHGPSKGNELKEGGTRQRQNTRPRRKTPGCRPKEKGKKIEVGHTFEFLRRQKAERDLGLKGRNTRVGYSSGAIVLEPDQKKGERL